MRKAVSILAPALLLTLAACATPFKADVSRFQQMPAPQGQTFTVKAADPVNEGGIEFGQYAAMVSAEMTKAGYIPAAAGSTADSYREAGLWRR
jgi:hypothetical protein